MPDPWCDIQECDYITCPHCHEKQFRIQNNSTCQMYGCGKNMYKSREEYKKEEELKK